MQGLILVVLLAVSAQAKTVVVNVSTVTHEIDLGAIEASMRAAGYAVIDTICMERKCAVRLSDESKATAAMLTPFFDNAKTRSQRKADETAAQEALVAKLKSGEITDAEKTELLLRLLEKAR